MHFKLDENIPIKLKDSLKNIGYSSSTVLEENLSGKKDKELIGICKREKFILITLDDDFSNIIAYPPSSHSGIIVFKTKYQGLSSVVYSFQRLIEIFNIKEVENSILIFDGITVKIRK